MYIAPEGILHYVSCHDYLPPPEFCTAVLASPDEGSPEYFEALRAGGLEGAGADRRHTLQFGLRSIVEARGRALVGAFEVFRMSHGRWPDELHEATALVDDSGAWHYTRQERSFTLETDEGAFEAFALRYRSEPGVWEVATGSRWW